MLERLTEEKTAELSGLERRLSQTYGTVPDQVYVYSATNRTVYLVSTNETDVANSGTPAVSVHRVFSTEEECSDFLNGLTAKQLTLRQIEVFREVSREKELEAGRVAAILQKRFGVRPDESYRFDAKTRSLYRVFSTPSSKTENLSAAKNGAGSAGPIK